MTTKQYVKKYDLDTRGCTSRVFEALVDDLILEFKERVENTQKTRLNRGLEFSFNIFQELVKEMQQKFCAISAKANGGLPKTVWNNFYGKGVIHVRGELFPKEHQEISEKRERWQKGEKQISEMEA